MSEEKAAPEGMITAESFAKSKEMLEFRVIEMIKSGLYVGRVVDGTWYIDQAEKDTKTPHSSQDDLDMAQKALSVGSILSGFSTFFHVVVAIGFTALNSQGGGFGVIFLTGTAYLGILASWSVIHALLSIVVTNALTAKYMIYQSSKKINCYKLKCSVKKQAYL